jgi:N-acetylglucosamine kinase-like BadF-type ATPase
MKRVAGIDGGATRTRALIASEDGTILGSGTSGPSNYDNVGIDTARANIGEAVAQACRSSHLEPDSFDAVFLGMAGVVSPADRKIIHTIASQLHLASPEAIHVDHDIRIALAGGLGGKEGVVLIAGTGSSTYGRRADGKHHRTGWGYLLDDRGSAYDLGLQAMIAAVRAADGRAPATVLSDAVRTSLGFSDIDDIMKIIYHDRPDIARIASLAPAVVHAAEQGDAAANVILDRGASELSGMVRAVAEALDFRNHRFLVTMTGGLVESSRTYNDRIRSRITSDMPTAEVHPPLLPPVAGAVLLALAAAGAPPTEAVLHTMAQQEIP